MHHALNCFSFYVIIFFFSVLKFLGGKSGGRGSWERPGNWNTVGFVSLWSQDGGTSLIKKGSIIIKVI